MKVAQETWENSCRWDSPQKVGTARCGGEATCRQPRKRPGHTAAGPQRERKFRQYWHRYGQPGGRDGFGAVGYLLKDRISKVAEFLDAIERVADGATVFDPQVVAQLLTGQRRNDPLAELTAREREMLALMAEGHSNAAIAQRLVLSASTVEKHIGNVFSKLGLPPDDAMHRRVRAVLAFLNA